MKIGGYILIALAVAAVIYGLVQWNTNQRAKAKLAMEAQLKTQSQTTATGWLAEIKSWFNRDEDVIGNTEDEENALIDDILAGGGNPWN